MVANPTLQAAIDKGEDTTGLCTVRDLAHTMMKGNHGYLPSDACELYFPLPDGRHVNVEVRITKLSEAL